MNTILTDDERRLLSAAMTGKPEDIRAVEAAVLAKLRDQVPVAWLHKGGHVQVRAPYLSEEAVKGYSTNGQWSPLYAAPQPAVVQVPQEIDVDGRRIAAEAENHACSIAVWMTRMDAESPDAEDLGVSGWLQEAETRIKRRMLAAAPEAPAQGDLSAEASAEGFESVAAYVAYLKKAKDTYFAERNSARDAARRNREAQPSVPAPWREAVKVMREALKIAQDHWWTYHDGAKSPTIDAAIALADSLEGGE